MRPHEKHRAAGPTEISVSLVSVSTSRYEAKRHGRRWTDETRDTALKEIKRLGYKVALTSLISDEPTMIRREAKKFLTGREDVLVFMGGTGVSSRDVTIETVRPLFDKELEGFGELVRQAGFRRIGAAAFLSRATAGVVRGKLILCLPGSPGASRDALREFGKEIPHALFVARS